jgi:outer membrane cobalamin receptor
VPSDRVRVAMSDDGNNNNDKDEDDDVDDNKNNDFKRWQCDERTTTRMTTMRIMTMTTPTMRTMTTSHYDGDDEEKTSTDGVYPTVGGCVTLEGFLFT